MLAGERKGLTRSGRKVVARYKNGFVASTEQEVFLIWVGLLSVIDLLCMNHRFIKAESRDPDPP